MKIKYDENVLIKLRRQYKEDEVVLYALNKISELTKENLELNKRVSELLIDNRKIITERYSPKYAKEHLKIVKDQWLRGLSEKDKHSIAVNLTTQKLKKVIKEQREELDKWQQIQK